MVSAEMSPESEIRSGEGVSTSWLGWIEIMFEGMKFEG